MKMNVFADAGKTNPIKPNLVRHLVRRSPLINPCGTETEALAKADSKAKKCCGVCPGNFCERKQAKTGIDVNEQA